MFGVGTTVGEDVNAALIKVFGVGIWLNWAIAVVVPAVIVPLVMTRAYLAPYVG